MAFLDKVTDIGRTVAKKSGEAVDVAKIKLKISDHRSQIKDYKIEMGTVVYNACEAGEEPDGEELRGLYSKIKEEEEAIRELEASL